MKSLKSESDENLIKAKDLAKITGEPYTTIDHWTDSGILIPARIIGRIRYYDKQESISRCEKIRELQNQGYGLKIIARLVKEKK